MTRPLLKFQGLFGVFFMSSLCGFCGETDSSTKLSSEVIELIRRHAGHFRSTGKKYNIEPAIIAGVITAEWSLNRGFDDSIQDTLLAALLKGHPDSAFWDRWFTTNQSNCRTSRAIWLDSGKWPNEVVASGYVMSFGPAQITPRTLLSAYLADSEERPIKGSEIRTMMTGLLEEKTSIEYTALILDFEAKRWLTETGTDVREQSDAMGTIYCSGGDRLLSAHADTTAPPINRFGKFVLRHQTVLKRILHAAEGD